MCGGHDLSFPGRPPLSLRSPRRFRADAKGAGDDKGRLYGVVKGG